MDPEVRAEIRAAVEETDPRAAWYFDVDKPRTVEVRGDSANRQDLTAAEVEGDEARFVDIPVITTTLEFLWMEEFVADSGDWRLERILDRKKGANERFLTKLPRAYPEAEGEWRAFRRKRVDDLIDDWLAGIGPGAE